MRLDHLLSKEHYFLAGMVNSCSCRCGASWAVEYPRVVLQTRTFVKISRWTRTRGVRMPPGDARRDVCGCRMIERSTGFCQKHWCAVGCLGQHMVPARCGVTRLWVAWCVGGCPCGPDRCRYCLWWCLCALGVVCENCIVDASIFLL